MLEQNNEKKEVFTYTYSAKQHNEINEIKQKYFPREENKIEQLRRLDKSVEKKGTTVSTIVGILGTMMLGIGLCCVMVWEDVMFVPGIIIGLLGIGFIAAAYPLHERIVKKERAKIAPIIMKLVEELEK